MHSRSKRRFGGVHYETLYGTHQIIMTSLLRQASRSAQQFPSNHKNNDRATKNRGKKFSTHCVCYCYDAVNTKFVLILVY